MQIFSKNCLLLVATLSLLTAVSSAVEKNILFKCADNLKLDTCFVKVPQNGDNLEINYVTDCGKGKKCVEVGESYKCVKRANLLEEGDKCKIDQECKTGKCKGEKCSYLADNEECDGDENCGLNSSCVDVDGVSKCIAMIAEGQSCGEDIKGECKAGLACGTVGDETSSTCQKRYSVADDTKVSYYRLCKGGKTVDGICKSLPDNIAEWNEFVEAFTEELEDFLKDDDIKQTEYIYAEGNFKYNTLGSKDVAEKYMDYTRKEIFSKVGSDDLDCVRDYFIRKALSSNKLSLSLLSSLLFFAILL